MTATGVSEIVNSMDSIDIGMGTISSGKFKLMKIRFDNVRIKRGNSHRPGWFELNSSWYVQ